MQSNSLPVPRQSGSEDIGRLLKKVFGEMGIEFGSRIGGFKGKEPKPRRGKGMIGLSNVKVRERGSARVGVGRARKEVGKSGI